MSCFCHFAGFEVKDAKAREAIKNIAVAVDEIKMNAKNAYSAAGAEDMGVEMAHSRGAADAYKELRIQDVRYDKNAGMVYVRLALIFEGSLQAGDEMLFVDTAGCLYPPRNVGIYPLTTLAAHNVMFGNGNKFAAFLDFEGLHILATDEVADDGGETVITIAGCYPYDEEEE